MKAGFRTPNIKKSVKARTTGKVKRAMKKSVNPLYGQKGIGYVKNPKKAIYNSVYNKTTIDARPSFNSKSNDDKENSAKYENDTYCSVQYPRKKGTFYLGLSFGFYLLLIMFLIFIVNAMRKYPAARTAPFNYILPVILFALGTLFLKIYKNKNK